MVEKKKYNGPTDGKGWLGVSDYLNLSLTVRVSGQLVSLLVNFKLTSVNMGVFPVREQQQQPGRQKSL